LAQGGWRIEWQSFLYGSLGASHVGCRLDYCFTDFASSSVAKAQQKAAGIFALLPPGSKIHEYEMYPAPVSKAEATPRWM
jgi:hypothetical protein